MLCQVSVPLVETLVRVVVNVLYGVLYGSPVSKLYW